MSSEKEQHKNAGKGTRSVHSGTSPSKNSLNTPVYQSSTFFLDDEDGQPIFTFQEEDGTDIMDGGDTDVTVHKPFIANSTITVAGVVDITDTTDSSDATGDTGALRVEGGVSIAKKLFVGTDADIDGTLEADAITVNGSTLASVIADEATALAIALG